LAGVGSITTITTALTSKGTSAAGSTSASTTASILGEFGLGLIDPILVDRLGAFRDAMIGITAIETSINAMFLWNIPLIQYIQRIEYIVSLLAQRLDADQTKRVSVAAQTSSFGTLAMPSLANASKNPWRVATTVLLMVNISSSAILM
jgi:hypothetical protein